jgi:hypothetical protein
MIFQTRDFNGAQTLVHSTFRREWKSIERILKNMPLQLKASDQGGIQGTPIFDPVGTNEYFKAGLLKLPGWRANIPIPAEFNFLGTRGIDSTQRLDDLLSKGYRCWTATS